MIQLSDEDILRRLRDTEDSTVERKTAGDYRDCLKTAVAFSNSLPVDDPGIIFVGVGNDGTVQDKLNLDSLQRDVSREPGKIYPPVHPQMKVIGDSAAKEFLAVIVRGSENRPHFAGPSYVRDGSQTVEASKDQFERLIAERNSKTYALRQWLGKVVQVKRGSAFIAEPWEVEDCNQFYAVLRNLNPGGLSESFPLSRIELAYDPQLRKLELRVLS
jgi:Schlafen, AlbA_2